MIDGLKERIELNAQKGYLYVGSHGHIDIWKKFNEVGGYSYYADYGWEHLPVIWNTAISSEWELQLILDDIKYDK